MKQISQNLSAVESAVAQLCAALRGDAQSEAGQARISTAAINLKDALKAMGDSQSDIESSGGESKKKALQDLIGPFSKGLSQFAKIITNIYERGPLPEGVASDLKPVLAKYEEVQESYEKLATDTGLKIDLYRPGLSCIPGPPLAKWTKLWRLYDVYNGQSHQTAIRLHKKHGPLVRIAPNIISVGDPAAIKTIYGLTGAFTKSAFYPIQSISWNKKPQMNLFSTRDTVYHREQKKKVAHAYSLTSLLGSEEAMDSCTELFTSRLDEWATADKPIDLGAWLQYYASDVVGEVTFAQKLGFLETGADVDGMMETIEGILFYAALCGQVPEMHPFLLGNPLIPYLIPAMESWNAVLTFTLKAINSRTTIQRDGELELNGDGGRDFLSRWAALKKRDPLKMSTRDVMTHLSTNVFAGSDTTAIALRAIVYFLIKHPESMRMVVEEIDTADKSGKLSDPISYKESTGHLPYMGAVIKEAMRLHPSVGLLMERHVPPQGAEICGQFIPGGTVVGINPWVLHSDPRVYKDPESFIPERWLTADAGLLSKMENSFLTFGAGSRTCIGKYISLMEMHKVMPQLLRRYTIKLEDPKAEWRTSNLIIFKPKNDVAMSGAEAALLGVGILCNAMQILTFAKDSIHVYRNVRDGRAPDPNLDSYLKNANASFNKMNQTAAQMGPLSREQQKIVDVGKKLAQGSTSVSDLILGVSTVINDRVADKHATIRSMVENRATSAENKICQSISYLIDQLHQELLDREQDKAFEKQYELLLSSLRFPEMNSRKNKISDNYPGTFKWIFDQGGDRQSNCRSSDARTSYKPGFDSFPDWLESDSKIFWVSGKPASGKSFLMKYLALSSLTLRHLKVWRSDVQILTHFFWKPGQTLEHNVEGMVLSLLHQVLDGRPGLCRRLCEAQSSVRHKISYPDWSLEELSAALIWALQGSSEGFCIFLDGLDEAEELQHLPWPEWTSAQVIHKLLKLDNIKLCVSSRDEGSFCCFFKEAFRLRIHELNDRDIILFVKERLDICGLEWLDRNELLYEIVKKAEGVFLWAALVVDRVNRAIRQGNATKEMLRERIDQTPSDLTTLYTDMWGRIGDDAQLRSIRVTASLYFNLVIAARRACRGLLEVTTTPNKLGHVWIGDKNLLEYNSTKVGFIHRTAFDFIMDTEPGRECLDFCGSSRSQHVSRLFAAHLIRASQDIDYDDFLQIAIFMSWADSLSRKDSVEKDAFLTIDMSQNPAAKTETQLYSLGESSLNHGLFDALEAWQSSGLFSGHKYYTPLAYSPSSSNSVEIHMMEAITSVILLKTDSGSWVLGLMSVLEKYPASVFLKAVPAILRAISIGCSYYGRRAPFELLKFILHHLQSIARKEANYQASVKTSILALHSFHIPQCLDSLTNPGRPIEFSQYHLLIQMSKSFDAEDWQHILLLQFRTDHDVRNQADTIPGPYRHHALVAVNIATAHQIFNNALQRRGQYIPRLHIPDNISSRFDVIIVADIHREGKSRSWHTLSLNRYAPDERFHDRIKELVWMELHGALMLESGKTWPQILKCSNSSLSLMDADRVDKYVMDKLDDYGVDYLLPSVELRGGRKT
ncbi:cytochrome P450 monooxygenase oxidoreductase [Fusarium coicis]|nr:cytochrome P450 monooxygenase oxidoreductase [Fusarium coicis]